ncbi:MAG: CHASE2 domain-containing protein [Acidobacteriota bacterium]
MAARPSSTFLRTAGYVGVLLGCFAAGMLAGWNQLARRVNNQTYDLLAKPEAGMKAVEAVIVAIDEPTLREMGELRNLRPIVTKALRKIAAAKPRAVAVDLILAGATNPEDDQDLEAAFRATPNLILGSSVASNRAWEDPLPRFAEAAAAVGHVHYEEDRSDGVSRQLALENIFAGQRRWAMALETFRVAHKAEIVESPEDLEVAGIRIPAARLDETRPMFIRFLPSIPTVSVLDLDQHPDLLRDKVVFLGVTASGANDRRTIPSVGTVAGVEVHAHAYETLRRGEFLTEAPDSTVVAVCIAFSVAMGLVFAYFGGWRPYVIVLPVLALALYLPALFLMQGVVFPLVAPAAVAWLSAAGAATYQHFVVRRSLRQSESDKARYQQAIHWAAHEMRTPLTAIQGSSELMTRYKLPEEKRGQLSEMINSESKRLARIIQTFLDVERLAEGNIELKRESFAASDVVAVCMGRVASLAERKNIAMTLDSPVDGTLVGDRELMEYAFYNLLTNAVKYSPPDTHVRVKSNLRGSELRLAVQDEGIGIEAKEVKKIFQKFYRTKRAEASGEVGTGIGLSIVQQIVTHHGGRMDVTSTPGKGSCFTMILTAQ